MTFIGSVCLIRGWEECQCSRDSELCHVCCLVNDSCTSTFSLTVRITYHYHTTCTCALSLSPSLPSNNSTPVGSTETVADHVMIIGDIVTAIDSQYWNVSFTNISCSLLSHTLSLSHTYNTHTFPLSLTLSLTRCIGVDNDQTLDDLLDIFTIDTLNSVLEWLKRYWWVPIVVVVAVIGFVVLMHLTYRKRKPLKNAARRARYVQDPLQWGLIM